VWHDVSPVWIYHLDGHECVASHTCMHASRRTSCICATWLICIVHTCDKMFHLYEWQDVSSVTRCFICMNLSSWRTRWRRVAHTYAWRTHTRMPQPRRTWCAMCGISHHHSITAFICATRLICTIHTCDMKFHIVNIDILPTTTIISVVIIIIMHLCGTSCICATCRIRIVHTCDAMFYPYSHLFKKIRHF